MARLTKDQIKSAVLEQIEDSEGYDTDELNGLRKDALDYYYNRPSAAPEAAGRSALQSSDVADMVEAVTAQIMPAFEIDTVVEFEPLSEDDVEQARAETDACNYVVMQVNNGYYQIQQAVRDALLLRNGIMKVYLDEKIDITNDTYENLTELEYGDLVVQSVDNLSGVDDGIKVELLAEVGGFYDVRVTEKTTKRQVITKAIDPSNFGWERDHNSIYLNDVRFCSERSLPTRSELIQMGYKKSLVNSLNAGGNDTQIDTLARNQHSQRRNWRGSTKAEDIIEFHECYIRLDADSDGEAELLKVCIADKTILELSDADYIPYASGTPFIQPHRFNGLGLFDKLRHVQDAKTATLRQLLDNQNNANNSRVGVVDGAVNLDDVVNSRPGGVVRMRSPDAIVPFPFVDIGGSAQATLDYLDKVRSERGGASLDLQSAELQIAGETAHGVERQMSAKEQQAAMITRSLADTLIRTTFELVHKALRLYVPNDMQFRVSDKFVTVSPADWQERDRINVKAGLSMAERMRKSATLEGIMVKQGELAAAGMGGIMTDPSATYNTILDWARCNGIDNPERYFQDPTSEEAQAASEAQSAQAEEEADFQRMLLALQQEVEDNKDDNEKAKIFEDARQFDKDMEFKYAELGINTEIKEAEQSTAIALEMVRRDDETSAGTADAGKQSVG